MNPAEMRLRDLRRLVRDMWDDPRCDGVASAVLDAAIGVDAKSCDRAVIAGYLDHFPTNHPAFERLTRASELAANRRDWPWRERGLRWRLWDREAGPARLANALLESDDPAALLREAGLDGDLAEGEFVAEALEDACEQAGAATGDRAIALGERLIALFGQLSVRDVDVALVDGLLRPWSSASPPDSHKRKLGTFLTSRLGDPRMEKARWSIVADQSLIMILRRWLTEAAVRAFFSIVGRTAERKDQWAAREAFWLGYLDAGAVNDGWFAFGRRAEQLAGTLAKEESLQYGRVTGGADPSHSALIMSIGDVRIAEWSHNGSCRFWPSSQKRAPIPYRREYDGNALRMMTGGSGFDRIPHTSGWQPKFARKIYAATGVTHPVYGRG